MARMAVSLTVNSSTPEYERFSVDSIVDPVAASTYAADKTAFESALATLVADGASPTQAHVTAANSAYTTFKADLAAPPTKTDVVVSVDLTNAPTLTCIKRAFDRIVHRLASSSVAP